MGESRPAGERGALPDGRRGGRQPPGPEPHGLEGTLRGFARFDPVDLWFDYPVHRLDGTDVLRDVEAEGAVPQQWKAQGKRRQSREQQQEDRAETRRKTLEMAYESILFGGAEKVTIADLIAETGLTKNTVRSYIDDHPDFRRENGVVTREKEESEHGVKSGVSS